MKEIDPSPPAGGGLFTSCPNCLQQFRVHASQLSVASGEVICGVCDYQFNTLSRLSDMPLSSQLLDEQLDNISLEPEHGVALDARGHGPVEGREEDIRSDPANAIEAELSDEWYQYAKTKNVSGVSKATWGIGAFLLLSILMVQLAWFNRDALLVRYPQFMPIARDICQRLHCEIIRHSDINAIKLVERNVQHHSLYADRLLIDATILNGSVEVQPYPLIQFVLFNTVGEVIRYGEFKPVEYLAEDTDVLTGMASGGLIQIMLELGGSTEDVASFEFNFL